MPHIYGLSNKDSCGNKNRYKDKALNIGNLRRHKNLHLKNNEQQMA